MRIGALCLISSLGFFSTPIWAQEPGPLAKGIQDNSFLIEEAYNQERGVTQHTGLFRRQGRDLFLSFSQEWALGSQDHQFSWSLPYVWVNNDAGGFDRGGIVQLNYRYQLSTETAHRPAIAPRIGLLFPTDDAKGELGNGGLQFNLPVSKIISDRVTVHANAGVTTLFEMQGRQPTGYNLGGSVVYALSRNTNVLFEVVGERTETFGATGGIEGEFRLTLVPGFRQAFNFEDAQLVVGLASPIQFSNGKTDFGALLYLSFEHKVSR